jgi:glycosyltransferase involved in cell wall biosynthesis
MKIAMIYPSLSSNEAFSNYSINLVKAQNKIGNKMDSITYVARSSKSLFKQMKKIKKYDVIHIQHEYNLLGGFGFPFFLLYFLLGCSKVKIVTTMHTVLSQNEKFNGRKLKTFLRKILYNFQNRIINLFSNKIIVHADFFKEILKEEYGVRSKKILVLYQSIPEGIPIINKERAKKELNLSGPIYLVIGSLVPDHGADRIIHQAKNLGKTVLIVSNPKAANYRNDARITDWLKLNKEIVKKNNFEKYVRFDIRDLSNKLWWKYFSAADIVFLPYRGGIGSGIFSDSIAARKPIIGSNIKYFREFSKKWGFIKLAHKEKDFSLITKQLMKKENYLKAVQECERYAKEYGTTALAKKYLKLYNSIK